MIRSSYINRTRLEPRLRRIALMEVTMANRRDPQAKFLMAENARLKAKVDRQAAELTELRNQVEAFTEHVAALRKEKHEADDIRRQLAFSQGAVHGFEMEKAVLRGQLEATAASLKTVCDRIGADWPED